MFDTLPEGPQGLVVLQIPDMMTEEDVALLRHTEGVLQFAPAGQSVPAEALRNSQRRRSVASGAPDGIHPPSGYSHHAIVGAHVDEPIVHQEVVGDVPDLLEGLLVSVGYGLVGVVAAGHHQRDS